MSLDEETVQKPEEEWDHDEQHQRGQVAKDEDEHEPSLDATGRIEAPGALRSPKAIAMIAEDNERAATEVASTLEVASKAREGWQSGGLRFTSERRKEWSSQRVRACGSGHRIIDQWAPDHALRDRDECAFYRTTARNKCFCPLNERDERALRLGTPIRCRAVDSKRRQDEAGIPGSDDHEWPDRQDQAQRRPDRGAGEAGHELRAYKVCLAPAKAALCQVSRDKQGDRESGRVAVWRESSQSRSDGRSRTTCEDRCRERTRREGCTEDDQRCAPSIARRLAITPIDSSASAAGMST